MQIRDVITEMQENKKYKKLDYFSNPNRNINIKCFNMKVVAFVRLDTCLHKALSDQAVLIHHS